MSKDEQKIYFWGYVVGLIIIVACIIVVVGDSMAKNDVYADSGAEVDKISVEAETEAETGGLMPCEAPDAFREWYATYSEEESASETEEETDREGKVESEPETSEETELETDMVANRGQEAQEERGENETEAQATTEVETSTNKEDAPIYSVNGEILNPDLQDYLYQRLYENGCEFFFRYAILICYQESHFNCTAVNPVNHEDMGLFQYKSRYWDWSRGDIFDPYVQIDVFVENMSNRANMGLDVYEMISRHNVSDFGSYNPEYVRDVMKHEGGLEIVGN